MLAASYFSAQLLGKQGGVARNYLAERGLDAGTAKPVSLRLRLAGKIRLARLPRRQGRVRRKP